jgi:hypothetical protein
MTGDKYREASIALGKLENPTFTGTVTYVKCPWCGMEHPNKVCSLVKALDFYADGKTVKRVEFKTAVDYPPAVPVFKGNGVDL